MQKAIIISGPTASGKTDLAYSIAQNIPVVLLNADSRQIYKQLSIISGKDIPENSIFAYDERFKREIGYYQLSSTRLYLMDLLEPSQEFSIHGYSDVVREILPIITRENTAVIVGGSNFYIASLQDSIETKSIPQDIELRKKIQDYSVNQLRNMLYEVDKQRLQSMNDSDGNNPRRLIRAIEVGEATKNNSFPSQDPVLSGYEVLHIGLTAPLDYIRKKIDARVDARIAQGALNEADSLFKIFDTLSQNVKTANGYAQLFSYLLGNVTYEEAVQRWKFAEYHNAKKQLTWIHGNSNIIKYSILDDHFPETVLHDVLEFTSS